MFKEACARESYRRVLSKKWLFYRYWLADFTQRDTFIRRQSLVRLHRSEASQTILTFRNEELCNKVSDVHIVTLLGSLSG